MADRDVVLYSTDWCPWCTVARRLLERRGIPFREVDLTARPTERQELRQRTGRRTVPQIFIGEVHVGGCDDLVALDRQGGLLPLVRGEPDR